MVVGTEVETTGAGSELTADGSGEGGSVSEAVSSSMPGSLASSSAVMQSLGSSALVGTMSTGGPGTVGFPATAAPSGGAVSRGAATAGPVK